MQARQPSRLEVQLLGRPRCRPAADAPWIELSALDAAALALLALDGPQPRDRLAGLLFQRADERQAPNNLRKRISRLRSLTAQPIVDAAAVVRLRPEVVHDLRDLSALPEARLLDDELLAGCDYTAQDALDEWVAERREALRQRRADALAGHAEALERAGELAAAIRLALRIVDLAPYQEVAWRRLMRLHYLRGDHTAAVEAFERFEAALREQTGARPGPETLQLLATIEQGAPRLPDTESPRRRLPVCLVRPPHCVGREAELDAMQRAWSGGRPFVLLGEAGIGKSRVLAEFLRGRDGVLFERARPGDVQAPFTLMTRLLRAAFERAPAAMPGDAPARAELARLMPELGPAPAVPAHEAHLRHAVEVALCAAVEAGAVRSLVVDDLHFADPASLELLRWLGASLALEGLDWGFASRPLDEGAASRLLADWLLDSQRPEGIALGPLPADGVEQLLGDLALPEFSASGLGARLHAHAGGQPLFTLETLKQAWLQGRDLRHAELPRPQTVRALIEGRLRDLPADATALLRVAAVAGIDLDGERAAHLLGVDALALADAWAALDKFGILQGERFAHDLLHECALGLVAPPLRRALHARLAALLGADPRVPAGRVADHWQQAGRPAEAGAWWHRAGLQARQAGRLLEQQQWLERAAACHREAGLPEAEFESVRASFDGLLLRHGGNAVLGALPRLEALASTPAARLECRLLEAEALLDVERSTEALAQAGLAVEAARGLPRRLGDALCLQGMAMAQLDRADEAVSVVQAAVQAARASADAAQELRAVRSLAYSLYQLGRLGEALPVQRRAGELALALGDEAESAAAEAAVAALLGLTGDVPASYAHARSAARRYEAMGLALNSTAGAINLVVWGMAAAHLGRLGEALQVLTQALEMASHETTVALQAKARLSLAQVQLSLGDSATARALAQAMPGDTPPAMRMQAALVLARADQADGRDGQVHLDELGRLGREHPDLPLVQSAWIEWSHQGDAGQVLPKLAALRAQTLRQGLPGIARLLQLREVDRLGDCPDRDAAALAARHALELQPHIAGGMSARLYPPEGWAILARAFDRAQHREQAAHCRHAARRWIHEVAKAQLPATARERFLWRNPVNRSLLADAA